MLNYLGQKRKLMDEKCRKCSLRFSCANIFLSVGKQARTTPVTVLIASATRTISCSVNTEIASLAVEMVIDFDSTTKSNAHAS